MFEVMDEMMRRKAEVITLSLAFSIIIFSCMCTVFMRQCFSGFRYINESRGLAMPILSYVLNIFLALGLALTLGFLRPDQLWYPAKSFGYKYIIHVYVSPTCLAFLFFSGSIIVRLTTESIFDNETRLMPWQHKLMYLFIEPILEEFIFRYVHLQILTNRLTLGWAVSISAICSSIVNACRRFFVQLMLPGKINRKRFAFTIFYGFFVYFLMGAIFVREHALIPPCIAHIAFRFLGVPDHNRRNMTYFTVHAFGLCITLTFMVCQLVLKSYDYDFLTIPPITHTMNTVDRHEALHEGAHPDLI